ncbi:MAG: GPR endopeptidase [Firmicutes bacterium]|nr:GPR endopeptidase [Bacillota bacterium]
MVLNQFYRHFGINLDLAIEAHELLRGQTGQEIPGVREDKEQYDFATITTVVIMTPEGEQAMGKPRGNYITIEAPGLSHSDPDIQTKISQLLSAKLKNLLRLDNNATVLIIGLGNWNATPDALGPKVVDQSIITRHLFKYAPEALVPGMRPVCALAPGVLGITGIETAEIIKGVVEKVQPNAIIVIDALAAKSVNRIGTTIQLADTGIHPGSGVGNKRTGINQATMGVPVIAIGVPTVVHAAVIIEEAIQTLFRELKMYQGLRPLAVDDTIRQVLEPFGGNLTVTPKEIDSMIQTVSKTIAGGISMALHPQVNPNNFALYLQ